MTIDLSDAEAKVLLDLIMTSPVKMNVGELLNNAVIPSSFILDLVNKLQTKNDAK